MDFDPRTKAATSPDHSLAAGETVPRNAGVAALRASILDKLNYHVGKARVVATDRDWFVATALAVRDRMVDRWMASTDAAYQQRSQAGLLPVARIPDRPAAVRRR